MTEQWGEAPGDIMLSDEGNILVPGTMNGNIFMTVQPARQYGMDPARAYHDPTIAPTHQYLAFYYWLREVFKADAVIHLGTHGNLEWLPGKATGLDRSSYSDIALGSLPNIYPYLMTISGEGVIAKRRSSACLIGYLPAPVAEAGAFDELAELEKMADEYSHFQKQDSEQAADWRKKSLNWPMKQRSMSLLPMTKQNLSPIIWQNFMNILKSCRTARFMSVCMCWVSRRKEISSSARSCISCACQTGRCLPYIISGQKN